LLTDRHQDKKTDKQRALHNVLGGHNEVNIFIPPYGRNFRGSKV